MERRDLFIGCIDEARGHSGRRTANPPTAQAHMALGELRSLAARKTFEHIPQVIAALYYDHDLKPADTEAHRHYTAALEIMEIMYEQLRLSRDVPSWDVMWSHWLEQWAAHLEREERRMKALEEHDTEIEAMQAQMRADNLGNPDNFRHLLPGTEGQPAMPGLWPMISRE